MTLRVASVGFGAVGRALAEMLTEKRDALRAAYQLEIVFTGALTRSAGGWVAPQGISPHDLAASGWPAGPLPRGVEPFVGDGTDFARGAPADVILELTTLQPLTGEPALTHARAALDAGRHVVTANKGPIAHGYRELRALAAQAGVALRFESTVMDGTPVFGLVEETLPVTVIGGFEGVLNSTSNFVLSRMASGEGLEAAIEAAQHLGIAEANPAYDLDGWDASVKATVLANVLMGADTRPQDVRREETGRDAMLRIHVGRQPGQTIKQLVRARRTGGSVEIEVRTVALEEDSLLAHLSGMETALVLHTDTMQDLTIVEGEGGPGQTAFGVLADLVHIARQYGFCDTQAQ